MLKTIRQQLPTAPGVYYFYSASALLYIGKAINIKARVNSHFYHLDQTARHAEMMSQVKRIEYRLCAGELGALLLEAAEIKNRQPLYNRRLRKYRDLFTYQITAHPELSISLQPLKNVPLDAARAGLFRSRSHAVKWLDDLAREHSLCKKILGIEKGKGACFGYQLSRCFGACCGKEARVKHDARLHRALTDHVIKIWPWKSTIAIHEANAESQLSQYHIFSDWRHICSVDALNKLAEHSVKTPPFDRDSYRILLSFLTHNKPDVIELNGEF